MSYAADITEQFQRTRLEELLTLCTEQQREFFYGKCYPKGIPKYKLLQAIELVHRTLESENNR